MSLGSPSRGFSLDVGRWHVEVLELGVARHPRSWVSPHAGEEEWMWSPINAVLARSATETILVDTGAGILGSWWPHEGFSCDLYAALARAAVTVAGIDRIVLSHLDFDHVGGALAGSWPDDLEPAFLGAPVVVRSEAASAARSDVGDEPLNAATRSVRMLETAGVLVEAVAGGEVTSEFFLRLAPGHRPGHAIVEIGPPGDEFVFLADLLHHPKHAEHPEWDALADADVEQALSTRRMLLAELADRRVPVCAAHIPAIEPMRVETRGTSLRLVAYRA